MSSARYEDLGCDLQNLKEKVKARLRQNISELVENGFVFSRSYIIEWLPDHSSYFAAEGTLNSLFSEGDGIVLLMKKETDLAPSSFRNEMQTQWALVNGEWSSFKRTCRKGPGAFDLESGARQHVVNANLIKGNDILERTSASVFRATQVSSS